MEPQAHTTEAELFSRPADRRAHPRAQGDTHCMVKTRTGIYAYTVRNLSISGALLVGGPSLSPRSPIVVLLRVPLYPEVRLRARVVRTGWDEDDDEYVAIAFVHVNDTTKDHIQSALLSELERSRTNGCIADILRV